MLSFEWDARKNAANRRKHKVDSEEATSAFGDPLSITISDPDHSVEEARFVLIGSSSEKRLLVVVHTWREERLSLISARPATKNEKRNYEETVL